MSTGKRLSRVVGVAGVPPGDLADLFTATAGRQFAVLAEYDRGSNAEQIQVLSIARGNGPLVCQSRSSRVWFQVGIVSWGTSNCNVRAPVVYACVSFLCPWIDQVVASN
ncbi:chymotrypsin-like protease CTRL-1 [Arapaima gigas]